MLIQVETLDGHAHPDHNVKAGERFMRWFTTLSVEIPRYEAIVLSRADVLQLAQLSPHTYENALRVAVQWCANLQQRFEDISDGFLEPRLARLVMCLADKFGELGPAELLVSDFDLAQMAGTNLYTVNKILNRWQRQGYVQKGRKRLMVLDRGSIKRLSEMS